MRSLFLAGVVVLLGCPLPSNVLYRCEADGSCALPGTACGADGFCHPVGELPGEDGGGVDAGPCVPRELSAACLEADCGFVDDGCGAELDCQKECPAPLECGVSQKNRCAFPKLCTPEGWCWESPLPQGLGLSASLRLDARHTWLVGESGVVLFLDGERSRLQPAPVPQGGELQGIHGLRPDELYAVGSQGALLHFDGQAWEREGVFTPFMSALRTVWSFGDGGAVAGGQGGRVVSRSARSDPFTRWTVEVFPSTDEIRDLFADGSGQLFAVTRRSELYARPESGGPWQLVDTVPLTDTLAGVPHAGGLVFAGNAPTRANVVRREADGGWSTLTDAGFLTSELLSAPGGVLASNQNQDFLWLGDDGASQRFTVAQGPWSTAVALPGPRFLLGGPFGAMAVAAPDGGAVRKSSLWVRPGHNLNALCGSSPGAMYAVGGTDTGAACGTCEARYLTRQVTTAGVYWADAGFQLGSTTQFLGCYAENDERAWLTGNDSKYLFLNAGVPVYSDFGGALAGVYTGAWGTPDAGYFFTRSNASELTTSPDGQAPFSPLLVNAGSALRAVWGLSPDDILVVGASGATSRFDGVGWVGTPGVINGELRAVHGARLEDGTPRYVAAGTGGALYSLVGDAGTVTVLSPNITFNAAWVAPGGEAFAGGRAVDGGAFVVRSRPGAPWAVEPINSPRPVTGLFGLTEADGGVSIWVSGPGAAILRKELR